MKKSIFALSTMLLLVCLVRCSSRPSSPETMSDGKRHGSNIGVQDDKLFDSILKTKRVFALKPELDSVSLSIADIVEPPPNTCHENPIGFNTRNRGDVQQIIWKNEFSLHQAYKTRLKDENRERPDIIYVKFSINEYGKVIFAQICHSTMNDFDFEKYLIKSVKCWKFGKSLVPSQIYELTYPFVFSQQ